jgi:microcystin-dependent protein
VDTSNNPPELKIYNGASFSLVSFLPSSAVITNPSGTAPSSPTLGQLWLDTSTTPDELKVYDGSQFVRVDPLGITQTAGDARYLQITTASTTYLPLAGGTLTGTLTLDAAPTADLQAATKKYVDDEIAGIDVSDPTPSGTIIYTARTTEPPGYLKAAGQQVSRDDFPALFAAIGTIYGSGNGSTTFNVPDLRGEFIRGFDDGRGIDSGRTLGSAQAEMIGQHNHTVNDPGHSHSLNYTPIRDGGGIVAGRDGSAHYMNTGGGVNGNTTGISINNNSGTENRPRNVALLACIKT